MKKVLLMNSGGPDCAAIAARLHTDGFGVVSLYLDMGFINRIPAMEAAEETARRWCVEHHVAAVDFGQTPSYVSSKGTTHAAPGLAPMVVVFGSVWAGMRDLPEMYCGVTNGIIDPVIRRSEEWREHLDYILNAIGLNERPVERHFPLWDIPKSEEAAWAGLTPEDLRYTVTCGAAKRDDTCIKCVDRRESGIPV